MDEYIILLFKNKNLMCHLLQAHICSIWTPSTIVGILTFMRMVSFMLNWVEIILIYIKNANNCWHLLAGYM